MKLAFAAFLTGLNLVHCLPPNIPHVFDQDMETKLGGIPVAPYEDHPGYSRERFSIWHAVEGQCNTRETVLQRDGENVEVNDASCRAQSGEWYSPYDGFTHSYTNEEGISNHIDIEHMVPLKHAWITGAWNWTAAKREAFGNDLAGVELWSVTHEVNQNKSDSPPQDWMPPLGEFHCEYILSWIEVKSVWGLFMSEEEGAFLWEKVSSCR